MKVKVYDDHENYIGSTSPKFERGSHVKYKGEVYKVQYRYFSIDEAVEDSDEDQPWEYRLDGLVPIISEQYLESAS